MKDSEKKQQIRDEISRKRRYLKEDEKKTFDDSIAKKLTSLKEWKKSKYILIYVSHKNEIKTTDIIKTNIKKKHIIVPKTHLRFHTLSLHKIKTINDLIKGRYDLLEPHAHTEIISPEEIELAIIPGIAFDLKGHRIGYGKAYYDRLNKHLKCPKIGLAYSFQIVENIPAQSHDIPLDILVTEKDVHHFTH
jgi:5-formyltetrahydrofolate cyclo-ligase